MQLIVLGMHRSGTSMVARVLNLLGCYFGPEGVGLPANAENPKGFWERHDVVALNDSLLLATGAEWSRPLAFAEAAIPPAAATEFESRAARLVLGLDAHRPWFIKDPRLCLTLPAWLRVLEAPLCVHVVRHPLEAAASLRTRSGMAMEHGLALWELHLRRSVAAAADLPQVVVWHRDLIGEPVPTVARLARQLRDAGATGLRLPSERELVAFVSRGLHRERSDRGDLQAWADAPQVRLFRRIEAEGLSAAGSGEVSWDTARTLALHEASHRERVARGEASATGQAAAAALEEIQAGDERNTVQLHGELVRVAGRLAAASAEAAALRRHAAVPPAPEPSLVRRLWKALAADPVRPEIPADDLAAAIALIERSELFDRRWYLEHNPDVVAAGVDPAVHYLLYGGFEGRRPGPRFDSAVYLLDHLDAVERGINPLVHHLTREGGDLREPGRDADPVKRAA